jgi:hypothetical protein
MVEIAREKGYKKSAKNNFNIHLCKIISFNVKKAK